MNPTPQPSSLGPRGTPELDKPVQAHFRRGVARRSLGKGDEAKEDLQAAARCGAAGAGVAKHLRTSGVSEI